MKARALVFIFLLLGVAAIAQEQDTTTFEYCEVLSISKNLSALSAVDAVNVFIDFGGGNVFTPESPMKDNEGNNPKFNSQIDCLNYLATMRWKVGQTAMFFQQGSMTQRSITRYTLYRPKYPLKK